jgi:predicted nucleic acid-binding protein
VLLPTTVLGELAATFQLGSRTRENQVTLAEFLAEPFVVVLPTSATITHQYGRIFASLQRAGTLIPANDIWIAAGTIDQGATLLTFDQRFERVPGLERIVLEGV